jgi:murein DD-endopeptidase MepM/ murein hydrolase activator NlpD
MGIQGAAIGALAGAAGGGAAGGVQGGLAKALVGGAVGGGTGGALGAVVSGQNVFEGGIIGALTGAAFAAAMYGVGKAVKGAVETSESGGPATNSEALNFDPLPTEDVPNYNVSDLFGGKATKTTDEYGFRPDGTPHGGLDASPQQNTGFGTEVTAPSDGRIVNIRNGGVHGHNPGDRVLFVPDGYNDFATNFYHTAPHEGLLAKAGFSNDFRTNGNRSVSIPVKKGDVIGRLTNTGARINGAHVHIELRYNNRLYNPRFIFHGGK